MKRSEKQHLDNSVKVTSLGLGWYPLLSLELIASKKKTDQGFFLGFLVSGNLVHWL